MCGASSPHAMVPGGREHGKDYGAETAVFISTLIVLYLMAVVFLVRRQINQVAWEVEHGDDREQNIPGLLPILVATPS